MLDTNFTAVWMSNMCLNQHAWHCLAVLIRCCGVMVAVVVDVAVASGGRGSVFIRAWITSAMCGFCTNSGLNFVLYNLIHEF